MKFLAALLVLAGCASATQPPVSAERIAAIVASPERNDADRTNDIRRKPGEMLAFIGVREGWTALDIGAAGGYTTELIARAVGPTGRVYGQTRAPDPRQRLSARANNVSNLVPVVGPFENPAPPGVAFDLVTLMFNYHDFANVDRMQMNRSIFAALKPGGIYVVADHAGRPGSGISESNTLHRIEEAFLRKEIEAASFRLVEEGAFLRNPNDPRDRETPEPAQPKDEFVLKFRKP